VATNNDGGGRKNLAILDCRLAAAQAKLTGERDRCGLGSVDEGWSAALLLHALASAPKLAQNELLAGHALALGAPDPKVRSAALALLMAHAPPEQLVPILRELSRGADLPLAASAATGLEALTGQPVVVPELALQPAPPAEPLPAGTKLRIRTEKGDILIALLTQDAPMTTATLGRLAGEGYFKNLTFHRVVPDFVVQGGDPRGDGEGGPGFTQRCEVSPRPYFAGTVGLALAGKDTGGSQFFITHSPQPHLEGRYPVLGQVESGQEVADALLESDRILDVELLAP
jgi:cyclophilin family peptidyl-prolyl cis-trans isomerase